MGLHIHSQVNYSSFDFQMLNLILLHKNTMLLHVAVLEQDVGHGIKIEYFNSDKLT